MRAFIGALAIGLLVASACGGEATRTGDDDDDDGTTSIGGHTGEGGAGGSSSSGVGGEQDRLLTLSTILAPKLPFMFTVKVTTGGSGVSLLLQPLDRSDRVTPVGSPTSAGPYPLSGGLFVADLPPMDLPGEANPLSGNPITLDVTLSTTEAAPLQCGDADGFAILGGAINIDGSTFTMQPIVDTTSYPPALINCDGELAGPPP